MPGTPSCCMRALSARQPSDVCRSSTRRPQLSYCTSRGSAAFALRSHSAASWPIPRQNARGRRRRAGYAPASPSPPKRARSPSISGSASGGKSRFIRLGRTLSVVYAFGSVYGVCTQYSSASYWIGSTRRAAHRLEPLFDAHVT